MSLESWLKEFYQIDASDVTEEEAVSHSLKKWRGLTKDNLYKHELSKDGDTIIGVDAGWMEIDSGTCALCQHHVERTGDCKLCPLCVFLDGETCDSDGQPYAKWMDTDDPRCMIDALEAIL